MQNGETDKVLEALTLTSQKKLLKSSMPAAKQVAEIQPTHEEKLPATQSASPSVNDNRSATRPKSKRKFETLTTVVRPHEKKIRAEIGGGTKEQILNTELTATVVHYEPDDFFLEEAPLVDMNKRATLSADFSSMQPRRKRAKSLRNIRHRE
jgi:hypothetical protein